MGLLQTAVTTIAPIFIVTSPITSYADQITTIHRTKSSAGFSLDTPLIMLLASILRCYYWLGARFEISLLAQSLLMIIVQLILLKVALDNRRPSTEPFAAIKAAPRPYEFWQWTRQRPYWEFLAYFFMSVGVLQVVFGQYQAFVELLGAVGLGIEATLPIPQVLANQRKRSCKGFRVSVVANWLLGDVMKLVFFYQAEHVGFQFKACAIVQFVCDLYLGVQFWMFGNGVEEGVVEMDGVKE